MINLKKSILENWENLKTNGLCNFNEHVKLKVMFLLVSKYFKLSYAMYNVLYKYKYKGKICMLYFLCRIGRVRLPPISCRVTLRWVPTCDTRSVQNITFYLLRGGEGYTIAPRSSVVLLSVAIRCFLLTVDRPLPRVSNSEPTISRQFVLSPNWATQCVRVSSSESAECHLGVLSSYWASSSYTVCRSEQLLISRLPPVYAEA